MSLIELLHLRRSFDFDEMPYVPLTL